MDASLNAAQTSNTQFVEGCKIQAEAGLAFTNAVVAAAEHMRAVQLEAARETELQLDRVTKQIGNVKTLQDLLTLQVGLLNDCCLGSGRYWTSHAKLAQQTQTDMAALLKETCTRAFRQVATTNSDVSLPISVQPFATAMKMVFEAAADANAAMMKAIGTSDASTITEKKTRKAV